MCLSLSLTRQLQVKVHNSKDTLLFLCDHHQHKMNIFSGYNFKLNGSCAPEFEPLRRELEEYFRNGKESRAQLCVFVGEEKVIDLHGSIYDNDDFGPTNLIPIFSAGKVC